MWLLAYVAVGVILMGIFDTTTDDDNTTGCAWLFLWPLLLLYVIGVAVGKLLK